MRLVSSLMVAGMLAGIAPRTASQPPASPVKIALVSDTHSTRGSEATRGSYGKHLEEVMADVNNVGVRLVLIAGDLTDHGKVEEMADFKQQIRGFRAEVLYVAGNHDVGMKKLPGKTESVTAKRVAAFETNLGPSFFVKDVSGLRIIGVTGSLFGSGLAREHEQWGFLEKELAGPFALPTLLLLHYPPFQANPDEPGGTYWNIEPEPRTRLLALIKRGGVRAVLSGHLHRPLLNHYDKIPMITAPAVSFGLPRGKQPPGWTLVTVPAVGEPQAEVRYVKD